METERRPSLWQPYVCTIAAVTAVVAAFYNVGIHSRHDTAGAVGFIDFQAVLRESKAGKDLTAQVSPKQQALQAEAQAKFKELKQQEETLNKGHNSMPSAEFEEKNKALQQAIADWNAQAQKREATLNNAVSEVVKSIQGVLRDQLPAIADRDNVTAILPTEQAFYVQKKLDITSEVIRVLDDKLPKVTVQFEEKK